MVGKRWPRNDSYPRFQCINWALDRRTATAGIAAASCISSREKKREKKKIVGRSHKLTCNRNT